MTAHSSILAWKVPWTEEPGGLQFMGLQRVGPDWAHMHAERYMHPDIHCSTIYNSQDMEKTQMSIKRGMDKEGVVHEYNGILLSHKKEWNCAVCRDMDGPKSEASQKEKNKFIIRLICGIYKNATDELVYKAEIEKQT